MKKFLVAMGLVAFARRLGIPQPLFAAYVNGTKKNFCGKEKTH